MIEEKFLDDFDNLDPYLMAGIQGVWSLTIWLILLPIFQNISCSDPDLCPFGRVENSLQAFEQMKR